MTIALLCPTRGRHEQFLRMKRSVSATIEVNSNVRVYACTNGDNNYVFHRFPLDCPTVHMWNKLAETAMKDESNKLFMLAADDMIFSTPLWDEALINHYNALENKIHVYALQDSRDAEGTPHIIVTREYINSLHYFLPPMFLHWEVDVWTVEIAKANNCFTHLKEFMLIHDKPSDKGLPDETFLRIRNMGWRDRDAFVARSCRHFLEFEKERLAKCLKT